MDGLDWLDWLDGLEGWGGSVNELLTDSFKLLGLRDVGLGAATESRHG